jgi:nitrate reductase gamma subunit
MTAPELLSWARGTGLQIAVIVFCAGLLLRAFEIFMLGQRKNLAETRSDGVSEGLRTIARRFLPVDRNTLQRSLFMVIAGYTFHIGLLLVIFFLAPHIQLFKSVLGFSWPSLATPIIDFATVVAMVALMALLWRRITHPVLKLLSRAEDYLVWAITFLPLLTGYMSYHHLLLPYTWMLAIHILSVELMLVLFPFTKLTHTFTIFLARWYNGMMAGQKGVAQ